jgi:hypothetical protein
MKITRTWVISLLVISFIIGAAVLGVMYRNAYNEKKQAQQMVDLSEMQQSALMKQNEQLNAQLVEAAAEVDSWNDKIALLQLDLEQAAQSLEQTQSKFPAAAESIEYDEALMALAEASNVSVRIIAATETDKAGLSSKDFTFYTNVYSLEISGEMSDILDFVDKIATSNMFKTGELAPVAFVIPQPLTQAAKNDMRASIRAQAVIDIDASVQGIDRIMLIEEAFLQLLGEKGDTGEQTLEEMTTRI